MTEGVEVTDDGAYGRLHLHSAYAHVALALSKLFQSCGKVVEPGEVVRIEARYSSARVGARIGDFSDFQSVFRVRRVTAQRSLTGPAFDTGGTSFATEALTGGAPEPWAATGRSFFFDPFEEAL